MMASHARYFQRSQGISVAPSGLLPSSLKSPVGSLVLGTSALVSARLQIMSLMTWCLSDRQRSSYTQRSGDRLVPPSLRNGSGEACIDLGPVLIRRQLLPIRCREQDRKLPQALRTTNQLSGDCAQPPTWPCWLGPLHAR